MCGISLLSEPDAVLSSFLYRLKLSHMKILLFIIALGSSMSSAADLNSKVLTLFKDKCSECHSEGDEEPMLTDATDLAALLSDETYVNKSQPEKGELMRRILLPDNSPKRMPKSTKGKPVDMLTASEKALLLAWTKGEKDPSSTTSAAASIASETQGSLEAQVQSVFEQRCAECHGETKRKKPFLHARTNLAALESSEFIVKGDPGKSTLFQRITLSQNDDAHMPPSDKPQLDDAQMKIIEEWIKGDAANDKPREFISLEKALDAIQKDLMAQPDSLRHSMRYLKLTNLYNDKLPDGKNAESDGKMDIYRAAISKLVNSLSSQGKVTVPVAVDSAQTIYRINIKDYGWSSELWERIVSYYPYGIQGASARLENLISRETRSSRAYVRADWFVFATAQEPLYHTILGLPESEFGPHGLEAKLGVDTTQGARDYLAIRAGFSPSGVSRTNRLVQRDSISAGGYWKSYDFKLVAAGDAQDLILAPLGPVEAQLTQNPKSIFQHDGGEIIFHLPNGLQGYYLSNAKGDFLPTAPPEVVEDRSGFRRTNIILNGISCIVCHSHGLNAPPTQTLDTFHDMIGPQAAEHLTFEEKQVLAKLYGKPADLQRLVADDVERFKKALAEAMPTYTRSEEPIGLLYNRFNADVSASQMASEFYTTGDDLVKVLKESADKRLFIMAGKLKDGLPFSREQFLQSFDAIAMELGFTVMQAQPIALAEFGGGQFDQVQAQAPLQVLAVANKQAPDKAVARFNDGSTVAIQMGAQTYRVGEGLVFNISAQRACHVRVTQFGADGSTTQLLPNAFDKDVFLQAGETRRFPANAIFETAPPAGTETLLLEVCTQPFASRGKPVTGEAFASVPRSNIISTRGRVLVKAAPTTSKTSSATTEPADTASAHVGYQLSQ